MRLNILLLLFTITVGFTTYADEYLPLVREGVKWVCKETKFQIEESTPSNEVKKTRFYTIEFRGDTVVDGITYKKCYRYSDIDWSNYYYTIPCSNTEPYTLLREEDKTVYASVYDYYVNGTGHYPFLNMMQDYTFYILDSFDPFEDKEIKFYEFNENEYFTFEGYKPFLNQGSEVYSFNSWISETHVAQFIEGIGFDSDIRGDLLTPFYEGGYSLGLLYSHIGLHHIEDADGNIIYKGAAYTEPIAGDLDGDGIIDVEDVNAAINIILKIKTMDDYPGNADFDGNGIVDVEDVNILINKILKLE